MLLFIAGMGGSGKDWLCSKLLEHYNGTLKSLVNYTTREAREGEQEGVDYYFVSENDFVHRSYKDFWLEARSYNLIDRIVRYATPRYDDFNEKYLAWGSIDQWVKIESRNKDPEIACIYLESSPKERIGRMLLRAGDDDKKVIEACRRLFQDEADSLKLVGEFRPWRTVHNADGKQEYTLETVISYIDERLEEFR